MASRSGDRRREERAEVRGAATLLGDLGGALWQVRDVSPSGLRLRGPDLPLAAGSLDLLMRLLGRTLEVRGTIAWTTRDRRGVERGLEVDRDSDDARGLLELCRRSRQREARGTALLVDADAIRRALVAEYMWALGYEIVEAAAPLEALEILDGGDVVELVAVAPELSSCSGEDLLAYVAESFPQIRRVVVESADAETIAAGEVDRGRAGGRGTLHAVVRGAWWSPRG